MTNVFALLLMLVPTAASADPYFAQTRRGRQHFDEVERISRNHDVNEYRGGALTLRPYVQLGDDVFLGLDERGRLIQVIRTPARTLGFLLSGDRRLVDLFYRPGEALVAIDAGGELLAFDRAHWERSPRFALQRKMLASFALTMLGTGGTLAYVAIEWGLPWIDVLVPGIPISVGVALQHALVFAMAFSEENDATDGLRPLGVTLVNYASAEGVDAHGGGAADYLLHARGEPRSLRELLSAHDVAPSVMFDASCEATLARGYPIRMPYSEEQTPARTKLLGRRD